MRESAQNKPKQSSTSEEKSKETSVKESSSKEQVEQSKQQVGQIFEESTQSISLMTKDMQETATIVSQMKKELEEKRIRIADLIASGKPFSDSFATTNPDMAVIAGSRGDIRDLKTNVQHDQRFYSNQIYELLSAKMDIVIEQNKAVLKLLNFKLANNTVFP